MAIRVFIKAAKRVISLNFVGVKLIRGRRVELSRRESCPHALRIIIVQTCLGTTFLGKT